MSHRSHDRLLVMLALRLKGFGDPFTVASVHELDPAVAHGHLEDLCREGLARSGDVDGATRYVLTLEGRQAGEVALAGELDDTGARGTVEVAYARFLELNPVMLALCTDWQVRDVGTDAQRLNDHGDPDYDAAVIARLDSLAHDADPMLDDLAGRLARYGTYEPRLTDAVRRLGAGELEYFTKPMIPSFHTVWFELHEDLLATLGVDRSSEHRRD